MADSENGNGNGSDHPSEGESALEMVEKRLSLIVAEEAADEGASDDLVHGWETKAEVTLKDLQGGLISVSKIAEAAIEGGLKMSADLRKALGSFQVVHDRVLGLSVKAEVNARVTDKVDQDLAKIVKDVHEVKKGVQGLQLDMVNVTEKINLIPAVLEMLGEIIGRLPEREAKPSVPGV